jgi:uncharacterized protein YgbK (DUF1537 family)
MTEHPPARVAPDARARIQAAHALSGRRIAVLDDDPTGSQAVHGVDVVSVLDPEEYAAALATPGSTCFILTNTRSLPEPEAVRLTTDIARDLQELGRRIDAPIEVVSRSDSTLRGHVTAEVAALDTARRDLVGRGYDGVLLAPAYLEAGRFTTDDVHWAKVGGHARPVGATEFARDATFGYRSSNLREFVAERSGGAVAADSVRSIGLHDIRVGGPARVAEILSEVTGGAWVVVNATDYADLEVVVLGLLEAQAAGRAFLHRSGPSFVRALAGLEPRPPLTSSDVWPTGPRSGHGLVVVGSHVDLTSRQLAVARSRGGLVEVELDVPTLAQPAHRAAYVAETTERVVEALGESDVLVYTSRALATGADGTASLAVARTVSTALVDVVRGARMAKPAWVVAKGGITSHDVALRGLDMRRAVVMGQLLPGYVSVFRLVDAAPEVVDMPYVVFAGNVGDDSTLAFVIDTLRGRTRSTPIAALPEETVT